MYVVPQAAGFFSCPPSLYHLNAQLACGGIAFVYWSRSLLYVLSAMQLKGQEPGVQTYQHSTRRAASIGDLQNTSNLRPDHPAPVELAFTFTVDVWEFLTFHRAFPRVCSAPGSRTCLYRWNDISRLLGKLKQDDLLKRHPPLKNYSDGRHQGPHHQTFCSRPDFQNLI